LKKNIRFLFKILFSLVIIFFIFCSKIDIEKIKKNSILLNYIPYIVPDYSNIVIPPNIGPLNFALSDSIRRYCVIIGSLKGTPIVISKKGNKVIIPLKKWKELLMLNKGESLSIDIFTKHLNNKWYKYKTIKNKIALENIDSYLWFRTINVLYNFSRDICIYERNIEINKEREILNALNFFPGCCNCHSFYNKDPCKMTMQIRTQNLGNFTLLMENNVKILETKFQYGSWHPNGNLIAYSINKVDQCFHMTWKDIREVFDHTSGILIYDLVKNKTLSVPQLFRKEILETWPCWSSDGKYLYFCAAFVLWDDFNINPPPNLDKLKYSLLRISYNQETEKWGNIDTVISSNVTGLSISQPKISPDGRFMIFCMHKSGNSPYAEPTSDLYLMQTSNFDFVPLNELNSQYAESWTSWSSNSRWIVYTSKKNDGIVARLYISYIDSMGKCHKPFILPQSDPLFYESFIKVYNVPELSKNKMKISQPKIVKKIISSKIKEKSIPVSSATPKKTNTLEP
jgi:hypothetical protein